MADRVRADSTLNSPPRVRLRGGNARRTTGRPAPPSTLQWSHHREQLGLSTDSGSHCATRRRKPVTAPPTSARTPARIQETGRLLQVRSRPGAPTAARARTRQHTADTHTDPLQRDSRRKQHARHTAVTPAFPVPGRPLRGLGRNPNKVNPNPGGRRPISRPAGGAAPWS